MVKLPNLDVLDLSKNSLNGSVVVDGFASKSLTISNLSENNINGTILYYKNHFLRWSKLILERILNPPSN